MTDKAVAPELLALADKIDTVLADDADLDEAADLLEQALAGDLEREAFDAANAGFLDPDAEVDEDAAEEAAADAEWEAAPSELAPDVEHEIADLDPDLPIVVSAFAGVGGIDRGMEKAGYQTGVQIEWDAAASRVLAARFPRAARFGDVRKVDGQSVRRALGGRRVAVLAGGFPCQDLSVAGKRAGLAGERSGLYGELLRLFAELSPDWLVVENVPGLLSSERGADFALFLGDLTGWRPEVPDGGWRNAGVCHGPAGTAAWRVLDARYFGVAQRRRRVFVVFHPRDRVAPAAVLLEPSGLRRHPAARVPSWAGAAAGAVGAAVRGRADGADRGGEGGAAADVGADVANALTRNGLGGGGPDDNMAQGGHLVPLEQIPVDLRNGVLSEEDVTGTLQSHGQSYSLNAQPTVLEQWEAPEEVAPTLLSGPTSPASHGKRSGDDRQAFAVARPVGHIEAHGGPDLGSTVTSKWSKGSGGPAGSETPNLVVERTAAVETGQGFWTEADHAATLRVGGDPDTIIADGPVTVVGSGEEELSHTMTASGTDGMGRGVPAIAYAQAVSVRGRGEESDVELGEPDVYNALRAGDGGSSRQQLVLPPSEAYIVDKERGLPNDEGIRIDPTDVAPTITADGDPAERTDRGLRVVQEYDEDVVASADEQLVVTEPKHFRKSTRAATSEHDETWVEEDFANTLNTFDQGDTRTVDIVVEPQAFIVEPESGQGADLVLRPVDHSDALTTKYGLGSERGVRVATAYPISQDALRGAGAAETPSADAEGKIRLRDPGLGVYEDGDPSPTVVASGPPAVGFTQDTRMDTPTEELASPLKVSQHSMTTQPVGAPRHDDGYADAAEADAVQALRVLRRCLGEEATAEWCARALAPLRTEEVLRPGVHGGGVHREGADDDAGMVGGALSGEEGRPPGAVPNVREAEGDGRLSPGRGPSEQPTGEPRADLPVVPHEGAQAATYLLALSATAQGARVLRHALSAVEELGRPDAGRASLRAAVRRLTPRECERLQGFPDDWTLVPDKNGKLAADSPRYKQLGNAVCATVPEWLGMRIRDYEDGTLYEDLPTS